MNKSIIIGNGINIQFDDKKSYTSSAIMERVVKNVQSGKYQELFGNVISPDELIQVLEALCPVVDNVVAGKYSSETLESGGLLALIGEYQNMKENYENSVPNSFKTIQLEDYFFAMEILNLSLGKKVGDAEEHVEILRKNAFLGLKYMIVDGIFNDGQINELYKSFPDNLHQFFEGFQNIFTINYDLNLDNFLPDYEIVHLHGAFNQIDQNAPEKKCVQLEHVYCNAVMSWSWLDKYGSYLDDTLKKDKTRLSTIDGEVSILGVNPTNDEQIFLMLALNPTVKSVVYYYKERTGINSASVSARLKKQIPNKTINVRSVDKLWNKYR